MVEARSVNVKTTTTTTTTVCIHIIIRKRLRSCLSHLLRKIYVKSCHIESETVNTDRRVKGAVYTLAYRLYIVPSRRTEEILVRTRDRPRHASRDFLFIFLRTSSVCGGGGMLPDFFF